MALTKTWIEIKFGPCKLLRNMEGGPCANLAKFSLSLLHSFTISFWIVRITKYSIKLLLLLLYYLSIQSSTTKMKIPWFLAKKMFSLVFWLKSILFSLTKILNTFFPDFTNWYTDRFSFSWQQRPVNHKKQHFFHELCSKLPKMSGMNKKA